MQAIILAAGMGKRLGDYTKNNTKCMLEVNGIKLIDRALSCLHDIHVSRVILVVGYKCQNVKDYVGTSYKGTPIIYVDNQVYDKTNDAPHRKEIADQIATKQVKVNSLDVMRIKRGCK